jgi:DNA-binding NarL/FixJ family response regulator
MPHDSLPPRYQRLVPLLAQGLPNKLIARELGLRPHTVEMYVSEMMTIFEAGNRTELAIRLGSMEKST